MPNPLTINHKQVQQNEFQTAPKNLGKSKHLPDTQAEQLC